MWTGRINESEAAAVRRIFEMSAAGQGVRTIAKVLNAAGELAPRAQQGRRGVVAVVGVGNSSPAARKHDDAARIVFSSGTVCRSIRRMRKSSLNNLSHSCQPVG